MLVPPGELREDGSAAAVLLSPFDNLIWDRHFTERLFGFKHVIEIYKRPHERVNRTLLRRRLLPRFLFATSTRKSRTLSLIPTRRTFAPTLEGRWRRPQTS